MQGFSEIRKNMWLTVVLVSIIGDVGTTWLAVGNPNLMEANSLWRQYFNSESYAMLLFGKSIIVGIAFMIDAYLVRYMDNLAFPLIPVYLIYSGTYATLGNLQVLSQTGMWSQPILVILFAKVAMLFVYVAQKQTDYDIIGVS